ncbi:MAG: DUF1343 domain-containing protein [Cytophagales bacterium]|nr:DUF1343 domain-containing protein [Cytophagales bacterium]
MNHIFISLCWLLLFACSPILNTEEDSTINQEIQPGAWQVSDYLPLLKDKKVGLCVNHSSKIGKIHLLDTLISLGINIPKVFTPEHGFTGTADAGEHVADEQTEGHQLISLFGEKREPSDEDVSGLDVIIFDMQDVGVRFYTYISTMHYMMEAASRNNIAFIVLDRPNPNGSYVDGPFLHESLRSFVGLHPIPIVHGLTIGELAKMIVGEAWLKDELTVDLTVIPVQNWNHATPYTLPLKPSPNLPNDMSIALYPSLCLFEGTIASVGRGTNASFQHIGHPDYPDSTYSFTPSPREGAKTPKYNGQLCYGLDFRTETIDYNFTIEPLIDFYNEMGKPDEFFTPYIKLLAGDLDDQIKSGMSAEEIRESWKQELANFKEMREKYLMYE